MWSSQNQNGWPGNWRNSPDAVGVVCGIFQTTLYLHNESVNKSRIDIHYNNMHYPLFANMSPNNIKSNVYLKGIAQCYIRNPYYIRPVAVFPSEVVKLDIVFPG